MVKEKIEIVEWKPQPVGWWEWLKSWLSGRDPYKKPIEAREVDLIVDASDGRHVFHFNAATVDRQCKLWM